MRLQSVLWLTFLLGFCTGQSENSAENGIISSSSSSTTEATTSTTTTTPAPVVPIWKVGNENQTCVLVKAKLTYVITNNSTEGMPETHRLEVPESANATGRCLPTVNIMSLSWPDGNLTFIFIKRAIVEDGVDTGKSIYWLTGIFGPIVTSPATKTLPAVTTYSSVRQPNFLSTSSNRSFSCETFQSIPASRTGTVLLEVSQLRVEAFRESLDETYSESESCAEDTPPEVSSSSTEQPSSASSTPDSKDNSIDKGDNPAEDNPTGDQEDSNTLEMSTIPLLGYTALAVAVAGSAGTIGYLAWSKFGRGQYTEF